MYPTHITSHKNKSVNDKDILTRKSRTVRVSSVVLWGVDTLDQHLTRKSTACGGCHCLRHSRRSLHTGVVFHTPIVVSEIHSEA